MKPPVTPATRQRILSMAIRSELDVVSARQRARQVADLCGFPSQEQVKIATAVSELARNVYQYARQGRIEFAVEGDDPPQQLAILVEDDGPGIAHLDLVLSGRYRSPTGMGLGLTGVRRLMDHCEIDSAPGQGTRVRVARRLPPGAPAVDARRLGEMGKALAVPLDGGTLFEMQRQNHELLEALAELKARQDELVELARELEDTNRGVVALYAELDEKAADLRRADAMKSRFLSNMSHEFRTPLSSIRALAKLLLDRIDGDLTLEQERQVRFILQGSEALGELVNDLLDLAKIEAGKVDVRPAAFHADALFGALRGLMRPLLTNDAVNLVFIEPEGIPELFTDEAKLSQILRNFISNALKFTERGEVAVSCTMAGEGMVRFAVRDTGLGIAPEHHEMIFEEFSQVENRLQAKVKGTGLGLPLCRKLAAVLGGRVALESAPGAGSTFSVTIPAAYAPEAAFDDRTQDAVPRSAARTDGAHHPYDRTALR